MIRREKCVLNSASIMQMDVISRSCVRPAMLCSLVLFLSGAIVSHAQTPVDKPPVAATPLVSPTAAGDVPLPQKLRIGPGDEADFSVYGMPDLAQHVRVSNTGDVLLPLIGPVVVAGLTADEAQALIEKRMVDGNFLRNPHVTFNVKDYNSEGITVLGEVTHPGTFSLFNSRRLYDAFAAAGGLTQRAGNTASVTHKNDPTRPETVALSNDPIKSVQSNVTLQPGDTVMVAKAGIVYVLGEVNRPGGYVLEDNVSSVSMMRLISMAAGPTHFGNLSKVQVMRPTAKGVESREIDLRKIMKNKAPDDQLVAEDIVYVPAARGRMAAEKGGSSIFSILTTLAVYRIP